MWIDILICAFVFGAIVLSSILDIASRARHTNASDSVPVVSNEEDSF